MRPRRRRLQQRLRRRRAPRHRRRAAAATALAAAAGCLITISRRSRCMATLARSMMRLLISQLAPGPCASRVGGRIGAPRRCSCRAWGSHAGAWGFMRVHGGSYRPRSVHALFQIQICTFLNPADSSALRLRRRAVVAWENPSGLPQRALIVKKIGGCTCAACACSAAYTHMCCVQHSALRLLQVA